MRKRHRIRPNTVLIGEIVDMLLRILYEHIGFQKHVDAM